MPDFKKMQLNQIRLDSCKKHSFPAIDNEHFQETLRQGVIVCTVCKGEMTPTQVNQYLRGYLAAGADTNDIWPNWKGEGEIDTLCPDCLNQDSWCPTCDSKGFVKASKAREYLENVKDDS